MDDKDLLILFREEGKERYAFDLIVRKYSERLYWHIKKMVISHDDANDLLQNTFIKAWNALPEFREESKLFTWLYRIATKEKLSKELLRNSAAQLYPSSLPLGQQIELSESHQSLFNFLSVV